MATAPDAERIVLDSLGRRLTVGSVSVVGAAACSNSLLDAATRPLLAAETLADVIVGSRNIADRMRRLDVFKSVSVSLDSPPGPDDIINVVYHVEEAPRLFARTSADFGSNDGSMNISLSARNTFGNAEKLSATVSYGVDSSAPLYDKQTSTMAGASAYHAALAVPVNANPDRTLEFGAYKQDRNHTLQNSYHERLIGLSARHKYIFGRASQEVSYDAIWRENHSLPESASMSVRMDAGHSLKSSLSHTFVFDSRNDTALPTNGAYVKATQEIAGLGGDVQHFKAEKDSSFSFLLPFGISATTSLRSGLVIPIGKSTTRNRINDRFFLGGPHSIRGFIASGVGPRDQNDSVGGDAFWASNISVLSPIPFLPWKSVKLHLFANGGSLVSVDPSKGVRTAAESLFRSPSTSVGLGLAARFTFFRLELNYCVPLTACANDLVKPGIQFGVGMNFM